MLLNLKGNLEMNLSARLSTAANMGIYPFSHRHFIASNSLLSGDLDSRMVRRYLIFGNLTLLQVQALLVSCLAAAFSFLVSLLLPSSPPSEQTTVTTAMYTVLSLATRTRSAHHPSHHRPSTPSQSGPREFLVVFLTAQTAASLSSAILGSFMCSLILLCRYWNLNPDNIAPAVASALGDLLTLTLLGLSSHFLYPLPVIGLLAIQAFYVLLFIASFYLTLRNQRIKGLLREGWGPLLIAMVISSGTGMFLDRFVGKYRDYGLVSIAQDGIPGGVGSVYVSRFSTSLHEAVGDSQHQRGDGHDHRATPSPHHSTFPSSPNDSRGWRGSLFAPKDGATKQAIKDARPRVSGLTLYIVTIPVQVLFLVAAYASKWLELPALWAVGFLVFFGATVRKISSLFYPPLPLQPIADVDGIGCRFAHPVAFPYFAPLEPQFRSGHLCASAPVCNGRFDWTDVPRYLL